MTGQIVVMDWYNNFTCPGGDCGLTCCTTNWKILLNSSEIDMYKSLNHEYRDTIVAAIDDVNSCFCGKGDGKCALLNEDGYCNIVLNVGGEYLSTTCKKFPRSIRNFIFLEEAYVEICCPLVAKMLFYHDSIFFTAGDKEFDEKELVNVNSNLILNLYSIRTSLISSLQESPFCFLYGKSFILEKVLMETYIRHLDHGINMDDVNALNNSYLAPNTIVTTFEKFDSFSDNLIPRIEYAFSVLADPSAGPILSRILTGVNNYYPFIEGTLNTWLANKEQFSNIYIKYIDVLRTNYSSFVENYYVYSLFSKWLPEKDETFGMKMAASLLELFYIHVSAMAVLNELDELNDRDFSIIIASISRSCDRNSELINNAGNYLLKKCTEDSLFFMMTTIG